MIPRLISKPESRKSILRRKSVAQQNSSSSNLYSGVPTQAQFNQRTFGNSRLMRATDKLAQGAEREERAPNLSVGPVDDAFEREANANAGLVAGNTSTQTNSGAGNQVQRKEAGAGAQGGDVSPEFAQNLSSARGGGSALPSKTLQQMNSGFGADFSGVRVHNDATSDSLNRSINARAFTSGSDIFFRPNEYNPGSKEGQQTIAHELTHVVQQGGAQQGVQRMGSAQIQRLMSARAFKKDTKLSFGRKGKSKDFFATITDMLNTYHSSMKTKQPQAKTTFLNGMVTMIQDWLQARGNKSSRVADVTTLRDELNDEINAINQAQVDLQNDDFTDPNVTNSIDNAVGDSMNKLDELTYGFDVNEMDDGSFKKDTSGGQFRGYFKKDVQVDAFAGRHRGTQVGIPAQNPEFGKRNLAMQAIDKLLDAKVIPPTFVAQHKGVQGIVMKKIEGITGKKALSEEDDSGEKSYHDNPLVRQGLSKLYLLDVICAQVDRHEGNYIINIEDGVIKGVQGIDNDLAFGKDLTFAIMEQMKNFNKDVGVMAGVEASKLTEIDKPFAERIVALSKTPKLLQDALAGLLSGQEIQSTVDRLVALAGFLEPLLNNNDGRFKTEWEN